MMKRSQLLLYACVLIPALSAIDSRAQAPNCDVICTPNTGASSYAGAAAARPQLLNARGYSSPIVAQAPLRAQAAAASSNTTLPGSQSYNYTIPILNLPGRGGANLSLNLYYNSRIWDVDTVNGTVTFNADRDFPSYGFRLDFGFVEYVPTARQITVTESDGTKHSLRLSGGAYNSTDGSFLNYNRTTNVLTYKNGTTVQYAAFPSNGNLFRPVTVKDTNGNYISITYVNGHDQFISTVTDTLGRVFTFNYDGSNRLSTITQALQAGGTKTLATFQWTTKYGGGFAWYNFSGLAVNGAPDLSTQLNVLQSCTYPNGAGYRFSYGDWAIINKIETLSAALVTRSYISYNYPAATSPQSDAPTYTQQTISPDGGTGNVSTWNYAATKNGIGVVTSMAVTDPSQNITTTNLDPNTGLISSVQVTDSSNRPLRTVAYAWTTSGGASVPSSLTTTLNDTGQQSSVQYAYDSYGNPTTVSEYDFGMVLKRQTVTNYAGAPYTTQHILSLPTRIVIQDGGGNVAGRTDFGYDSTSLSLLTGAANHDDANFGTGFTTRGNLSAVTSFAMAGAGTDGVTQTLNYDTVGNLLAQQGCCNPKTFNFSSATQYSLPDSLVNGPFTTSYTYYFDTSLVASRADENNQVTNYSYDSTNRTTQVLLPAQGSTRVQLNTAFDDAAASPTVMSSNTANNAVTVTTMDGLGHVMRVDGENCPAGQLPPCSLVSSVTNAYDKLWQRTRASNPFAPGETVVNTSFNYDGLGRVTQVTPPSAGNRQYQYSGNTVIDTDPAGKQRRSVNDAMGRLVEVDEPGVPPPSANNHATMQGDGNFVLYNPSSAALWATGTYGTNAGPVEMQDDGNLVLYLFQWQAGTWAAPSPGPFPPQTCSIGHALNAPQNLYGGQCITSPAGQYMLYMTPDGDLWIYDIAHATVTWSVGTYGNPGAYAAMQTDGNFVIYASDGTPLWASWTNGTYSDRLEMWDDGRIIMQKPVWNSGTMQSPSTQTLAPPACSVGQGLGWNGVLGTGQCLVSYNGLYELLMQPDGNLVLYNRAVTPNQALWSTNTALTPFSPGITFATTYTYDVLDNLTAVSQAAGPVNGQPAAGQPRNYVYDGLKRLLSATTPELGTVSNYYTTSSGGTCAGDPSLPCRVQDARGIVKTFTYDSINRPTGVTYSDSTPSVTYQYDTGGAPAFANNRLTKIIEGSNSQTLAYDNLGRTKSVNQLIDGNSYLTQYGYNLASQLTSITYPTNRAVMQNYDAIGRPSSVADGSTTYLYGLSYNAAGETLGFILGNTVQGAFTYNDHLQVSSLQYFKGSTAVLNLAYDYTTGVPGNNGQIQATHYYTVPGVGLGPAQEDPTKSENFTYDLLSRLSAGHTSTVDSTPGTWSLQWGYDRFGNRFSQTLAGGNLGVNQPQFVIDPSTNRIANAGYTYDAAGNLTSDSANTFAYDGTNRLKQYNGAAAASYTYFGALRIKKVVGTTTTVYVYSGSKPIVEYTNGAVSAENIYAGSQLLAVVSPSGTNYYHPDHLSTRAMTDSSGNIVRTSGTLPFGDSWYVNGTSTKWKFTSYERDGESGSVIDYAQFRYYHSTQGRFLGADPLAGSLGDPQSLNRYNYVEDDPVNSTDPTGLYAISGFGRGPYAYAACTLTSGTDGEVFACPGAAGFSLGFGGFLSGFFRPGFSTCLVAGNCPVIPFLTLGQQIQRLIASLPWNNPCIMNPMSSVDCFSGGDFSHFENLKGPKDPNNDGVKFCGYNGNPPCTPEDWSFLKDDLRERWWWGKYAECMTGKAEEAFGQSEHNVAMLPVSTKEGLSAFILGTLVNPIFVITEPALTIDGWEHRGIGKLRQKIACPAAFAPGFSYFPTDSYTMLDVPRIQGDQQTTEGVEMRMLIPLVQDKQRRNTVPAPDRVPPGTPSVGSDLR